MNGKRTSLSIEKQRSKELDKNLNKSYFYKQ